MLKYTSITIGALLLSACGSDATAPSGPTGPTGPGGGTNTDPYLTLKNTAKAELAASRAPAVSIAVMKNGEVVFAEAYGNKTHNGSQSVDTNTLFQLGSTNKMFTATATLQLVNENVITLDTTLTDALPTLDLAGQHSNWQNISMHHLLTHQGGFEDTGTWEIDSNLMDFALNGYPQQFGQMNPAGKFWNYSNPNWSYLGAIIEHHRNTPYAQVMEQSVFEPLGMSRTTMSYAELQSDGNYALGVGDTYVNGQYTSLKATSLAQIDQAPAGKPAGTYTWSTPSELVKMGEFLLNGNNDILPDDLRQKMTQSQVGLEYGLPAGYGYGVFIGEGANYDNKWYSMPIWEHGGNTLAYTNIFWVLPQHNVVVSIMSSGRDTNFTGTLVQAIKSVIELPASTAVPMTPIATDLYANHEGDYLLDGVTVTVYEQNGALKLSIPALDAANRPYSPLLRSIGGSHFVANLNNEEKGVTFFPDQTGAVSTYVRNREFVAIRKDSIEFDGKTSATRVDPMAQMPLQLK